jgi:hypothetical protein
MFDSPAVWAKAGRTDSVMIVMATIVMGTIVRGAIIRRRIDLEMK